MTRCRRSNLNHVPQSVQNYCGASGRNSSLVTVEADEKSRLGKMDRVWFVVIAITANLILFHADKTSEGLRLLGTARHRKPVIGVTHSATWRMTALANRHFAHRLYSNVARKQAEGNVMLSPFVVSTGLSMTLLGAEGETEKELMKTLGYTGLSTKRNGKEYRKGDVPRLYQSLIEKARTGAVKRRYAFTVASRLYGDQSETFLPEFIRDTERYYGARLEQVDFIHNSGEARQRINEWVRNKTEGVITEAAPEGTVTSSTLLALVSTAYFKGEWKHKFDPADTTVGVFTSLNDEEIPTEFMRGKFRVQYKYSSALRSEIVILPYKSQNPRYSVQMELFLPREKTYLSAVEQRGEGDLFRDMRNMHFFLAEIHLPKFRLEFEIDLMSNLKALGLRSLFEKADLSGMNGKRNLNLGSATHKTFVEVNEEGTTAGSSLVVSTNRASHPLKIMFNHPFVFIIREKYTNSILFMGRVDRPN